MPGKTACHYGPTNTFIFSSPIGNLELSCCPKGLHSLNQMDKNDQNFMPDLNIPVRVIQQLYQDNGYTYKPALLTTQWLQQYFSSQQDSKDLQSAVPSCNSIVPQGSFTHLVWKTLTEKVSFGQTISYGALAALCGNPKASRAVGMAMRSNPISLIMPCHRVIQGSGKVGNYSGGQKNKIKLWLLQHEKAIKG